MNKIFITYYSLLLINKFLKQIKSFIFQFMIECFVNLNFLNF